MYFCKINLHFLIPFSALEQQITKNECFKKNAKRLFVVIPTFENLFYQKRKRILQLFFLGNTTNSVKIKL
ncbi:hypothetical protein FF021_09215 [Leptospira noguchii]|nr:hypothetical protein FF021_09215 [Leptospira noguchii]